MDSSASVLAFKGSVAEAITEAKERIRSSLSMSQMILAHVILNLLPPDTNEDSVLLEKFIWTDPNVAEAVLKDCVFLHLIQGSLDSIHFSACYPIKAVPSISAVGYNGVLLWLSEGYVNAEKLLSGIQKAWSDLHSQEAAAAVLTAALVSNKSEEPGSSTSNASELLKASSEIDMPSLSNKGTESTEWESASSKEECRSEAERNDKSKGVPSSGIAHDAQEDCFADDKRVVAEEHDISSNPVRNMEYTGGDIQSISARPRSQLQEHITSNVQFIDKAEDPISNLDLQNSGFSYSETTDGPFENKPNNLNIQDSGADKESRASKMSSDVHLNIRLSDGASIRGTFSISDTLEMVKKYVDQNRTDGSGPYSLGIPYPRKLFSEQDMSTGLSELGFVGREALIVVPHHKSSIAPQREPASDSRTASPSTPVGSNGMQFGIVWKILSYFNPFSYFNSAPNSDGEPPNSGTGMWEYGPDPAARSALSSSDRSFQNYPSNAGASSLSGASGSKGKTAPPSWGSNVHTLRHEDEDTAFRDRNAFWNGNSTQYGGDDNK